MSSSEPKRWIYDVFLSFRGEDSRRTTASHLYNSLTQAGLYVFRDDEELQKGDQISPSLIRAIEASRISLVILSEHYAASTWCLEELEKIMECRRSIGQWVIPVFCDASPSKIRLQEGPIGEAFRQHLQTFSEDKVNLWRAVLRQVCSFSGVDLRCSRNEAEEINTVVKEITRFIGNTLLFVAQYPVGLESRVEHVINLLNLQQSEKVLILGILGIGGIGKTTIAKAIYNQIHRRFEGHCFLPDIRESWKQSTNRVYLQERLLSDIYKTTKIKIHNIESGKFILQQRLPGKRLLLILDDVDELDQLRALCGSREWFSPGSRIIITTRNEHLLKVFEADHISRMSIMDDDESFEHFTWHAFKEKSPQKDFLELATKVVAYCGGLPLAHEVIGSLLFNKKKKLWESVLEKLTRIPNHEIHRKLRISFDNLSDDTEKETFLDIAFFFIGMDRNDVINILDEYDAEVGISTLVDRSLVTVDKNNKLGMHDLLRDMGREIVREKYPKEPEGRSRLWLQKEVLEVLQKHIGTKAIEGLTLKLTRTDTICLKTEAFKEMKKLRLLQLAGVQLGGDFEYISKDLRWLYWHGFPLKYMPSNFSQTSLVSIELESSSLKLVWKEPKVLMFLERLKILNLSHSQHLTETPNFSYLPNLEKLLLNDCPRLTAISETIEHLKYILFINLEDCTSLHNLPRSFYKLKSLKTLIISGCSMIDKLENDLDQMESLVTLIADKTAITQVPFSIVRSKSIGYVSLCGYEGFSRDVFPSLIWSWMSPTNNFSSQVETCMDLELVSSDVGKLRSLQVECNSDFQLAEGIARILDTLYATYYNELEATPTTSQVSNMGSSSIISICNQFQMNGLVKSLLIEVGVKNQVSNILKERVFQKLSTNEHDNYLLPGDNYPDWLTFNSDGASIIFNVPHGNGRDLKTMTMCIVYSSSTDTISLKCLKNVLIINYTKSTIQVYKCETLASLEDDEWQSIISSLEPGDRVEIVIVVYGTEFVVKKTSVYLIYGEPNNQDRDTTDMSEDKNVISFGRAKNCLGAAETESPMREEGRVRIHYETL
ncbi:disease resistance protein RPV1-like [Arachis stenosperma]|uniref:disease resistance protein RPV1-like n=1 Tax=Arachis stenosperma TaxID=217475 RepID=UPI0025ABEB43|nr:disease resistance protein RPV1-like [Arachis stenosperma]